MRKGGALLLKVGWLQIDPMFTALGFSA